MTRTVYYNGSLTRETELIISPFNRGLLYGDGLFETLRVYRGELFRLKDHLQRLYAGMKSLYVCVDWNKEDIESAIRKVIRANNINNGSIRINIFRGNGDGPLPPENIEPHILITAKTLSQNYTEKYKKGIKARIVSIRRNEYSPLSRIKSLNYLDNIMGKIEATNCGADEAIFLNTAGYLAEGATSNIFMIKDNVCLTPSESMGILPGVTRKTILEILEGSILKVSEGSFTVDDLLCAQEAFVTNSLIEVMPLVYVNNHPIGKGFPGPTTTSLYDQYRLLVQRELGFYQR